MEDKEVIRDEFLTSLLNVLEEHNKNAVTDAEKELMYRLVLELKSSIQFTN